jgi:pyridine nucleotide-disulfide oxidoreductase family protein
MKRLLLLGGGHAHVHVLKQLADQTVDGVEVVLLTPAERQVYSGMLPGWIAGHYQVEECVIPLRPLAARASVRFVESAAVNLDLQQNRVTAADGQTVDFDLLSIDTGSVTHFGGLRGASEHAVAIRPIETFIDRLVELKRAMSEGRIKNVAVIGAGAGGVEIAMALQHAVTIGTWDVTLHLVSAANTLPGSVAPKIAAALERARVKLYLGVAANSVEDGGITLVDGTRIASDFTIVALGAAAAQWPKNAGLACDAGGYIRVNHFLQSVSHTHVFAAGDCASMEGLSRPKSGVYAVRAGPPLATNLRRALTGKPLEAYTPQSRSLYLISTGGKHAIGSWGGLAWQGDWVWRWKDRIDRAFIAKYRLRANT